MKRCRWGAAALALLLIAGLLSSSRMDRFCAEVADQVRQAATAGEDWSKAEALTDQAKQSWDRGRSLAAVLSDHVPLEQVDMLLALLDRALARRDEALFADLCAQLVQVLNALSDAHQLRPENLL